MQVRVLHIGPLPPPTGGMATVVAHLSQTLRSRCDVAVVNNAKTTPSDRTLLQGIAAQWRLLARLCRVLWQWRPDIVHIHTCSDFTFWRNGLDVMLAKLFGSQVLLHIHGGRFHEFLGGLATGRAHLARLILARADRVIVLGKLWEERLADWCPPGRMALVPNGVFIPADGPSPGADTAGGIVCVANYDRRKGLEDLIRAVARMQVARPVRLTLLGPEVEPGYREVLERLAVEVGIRDRLDMPGAVRFEEVARYFKAAEVFCLPSTTRACRWRCWKPWRTGCRSWPRESGPFPKRSTKDRGSFFTKPAM